MRLLSFLIFSFLLFNTSACKSQKAIAEKTLIADGKKLLKIDSLKNTSTKIYLIKNKKLEALNTNGSLSYKIVDNPETSILQFTYEKDMDKVAYDGGYKEELIFEIPNKEGELNYADAELQSTKMLFGRYCFCRGKAGLYVVKQGKLHVISSKKETHFTLQFKIDEVPQVTTEIKY